jgi:hypothetical protein
MVQKSGSNSAPHADRMHSVLQLYDPGNEGVCEGYQSHLGEQDLLTSKSS